MSTNQAKRKNPDHDNWVGFVYRIHVPLRNFSGFDRSGPVGNHEGVTKVIYELLESLGTLGWSDIGTDVRPGMNYPVMLYGLNFEIKPLNTYQHNGRGSLTVDVGENLVDLVVSANRQNKTKWITTAARRRCDPILAPYENDSSGELSLNVERPDKMTYRRSLTAGS